MRRSVARLFLGPLNFLLFQWAFVRLAMVVDTDTQRVVRWSWLRGVVPLTGWWSDYRRVA